MRYRAPEAEFQSQVIQLSKLRGWRCAHFRGVRVQRRDGSVYYQTPVQADGKGFPDLVMVRGERLIFAELKTDTGVISPEQDGWLLALQCTRGEVYVWRPEDWPAIEEVLR